MQSLAGPGVLESAVLPEPDEMMAEKVGPIIVPAGQNVDVDAVIARVRDRISHIKVPEYFAVRADPPPCDTGGKVLKRQLRSETTSGDPLR
jgi:non-ribosomal peptide synthetase component E (peptide arylation enzyme)